jgi:cobyrinic acid a,c-diamide synthase
MAEGALMSTKKPVRVLGTKLIDDDGIEHEWVEIRPGRWKLQEKKQEVDHAIQKQKTDTMDVRQ